MDGPNYEQVFRKMQCLHGGNPEDVKIIVRWLRFFKDQDGYEMYLKHYLPMLPADLAKEFAETSVASESPIAETVIEGTFTTEVPKKKRGRPSKKL